MKFFSLLIPAALPLLLFANNEELSRNETPVPAINRLTQAPGSMAHPVRVKPLRSVGSMLRDKKSSTVKRSAAVSRVADRSNLPAIYGSVIYANSWNTANGNVGIYRLPVNDGDKFEKIAEGPDATYGGALAGNKYYCTSSMEKFGMEFVKVSSYNAETWEVIANQTADVSNKATDLAYDPATGKVYGCFQKAYGSGSNLGSMNLKTYGVDVIVSTTDDWCAFAMAPDGTLYGIIKETVISGSTAVTTSSSLYKINTMTGAKTLIGETGCLPYYLSSACIDSRTGRMFWAVSAADDTAALYEVDTNTGKASLICNFSDGEEVTGLFTIAPQAEDAAPAEALNVNASFPEGSLSGTLSFDAPTTLFSGETATGSLNYRIMSGSEMLASGATSFGAHVSVPLTVSKAGKYEFTVVVSNGAGDSPETRVSLFIGKGTPATPEVTARYDGANFIVEWTPVTESADGGYINPAEVTYKVVRYPAGVVVENATSATSVVNAVDEPDAITKYWYGVTATYGTGKSKEALSNNVFLGSLTPPCSQSFAEQASLEPYRIINMDEETHTWIFDAGAVRLNYVKTLPMDDWLISPAVQLEKGKSYRFIIKAKVQSSSYPETFEVKFGKEQSVEAMTSTIIAPKEISNTDYQDYYGYILPSETGRYYIGIHGCSPANTYVLYVQGFEIESPTSAAAPAAPLSIKTVPDPNGAFRMTIFVTAPTTDFNNDKLESLSSLEICRDGNVVKTFRTIAPGETVSFADEMSVGGKHIYTAAAYNEFGRGDEISAEALVGINCPAAPARADIVETDDDGVVTISWPIVETDFAGNPLNPELVSYTIWQLKAETHVVLYDNIKSNSHTFRAVTPPDQTFVHFFVSAETEGGISPLTETDLIPCGQPYSLPFSEKFRNGDTESIMAIGDEGTALWSLLGDNNNLGITSRDGDNGFLLSRGKAEGDFASVYTAKIRISGIENPGVSFFTYNVNIDNTPDKNLIEVMVDEGDGFKTIKSAEVCSLGGNPGWVMMSASLADYEGKTVLVGFRTTVVNYFETIIDDIKIASLTDYDVAIVAASAPENAPFNKPFAVEAQLENLGVLAATDLKVNLLCNNEKVATKTIATLASGEKTSVVFEPSFTALQKEAANYVVEVEFAEDRNSENNISASMTVSPVIPTLPVVTDLRAHKQGDNVVLFWSKPDTDNYEAVMITDDFEGYESFTSENIGDWTTVDGDKASIGSISDVSIPNIPYGSQQSWWVMDADYEKFNKSFYAHSGSRYLAQMYSIASDGTAFQCDDWLISPQLTGKEQTISFYARSYSSTYPESFEVMVSSAGNSIGDFTMLANRSGIMSDWTLYSFTIPEGTQYFAIRCVSLNKFMMFLDDISYIPASASEIEVVAYNIWRDGKLIGSVDAEANTFSELTPENSDPIYVVTTVYDKGESAPSADTHITVAGVNTVGSSAPVVSTADSCIIVSGAFGMPVRVIAPDGRLIADVEGEILTTLPVVPGIYIVSAGDTTVKVRVP